MQVTDRDARMRAMGTATIAERLDTHERIAAEKADAIAARRAIAEAYLAEHPDGLVVPPHRAVATASLIEETAASRDEVLSLSPERDTTVNNGALEFPVLGHELAADGPTIALATSPLILAPVVRYLGMMPIFFNAFVTRAHHTELQPNSAHFFHLDPEDTRSFKVFVHLTDVDEGCGPFHALPADRTEQVLDAVSYRGVAKVDDDQVRDLVGWDEVVQVTGPAGTVAFADTTRCLHFGGRPRDAGKPVRLMTVFQYLLPTSVILGPGGDDPRRFMTQLTERGDETWDTLIGARHT